MSELSELLGKIEKITQEIKEHKNNIAFLKLKVDFKKWEHEYLAFRLNI